MNRVHIHLLFFFIQLTILSSFADSTYVNYFSAQNILKFARMLYAEEDYLRSAGEYQRFFAISNSSADSTLYKIALCYERSALQERSIFFYENIIKRYPHSPLVDRSYYQISVNLHLLRNYENSNSLIEKILPSISQSILIKDFLYLRGINLIYQKKWKNAELYFSTELGKNPDTDFKNKLLFAKMFTHGRFEISEKKPFLAGVLSAIVPGAGKIYCGQIGDGLYSLVVNALTGYLAWAGFHEDGTNSLQGWTFGTIAGIFYVGNIYGSTIAAQIFNDKQVKNYLEGFNPQIRLYHEINF